MSQFFDSQASSASTVEPITPLHSGPEDIQLSGTPSQSVPLSSHPPTAPAPRAAPGSRWTVTHLSLLIGFKRGENEKQLLGGARERNKTAPQRWAEIRADFAKHGMDRTSEQIRSKWEKLIADFKKVFDYQVDKPSGQPGYFEMDSAQRKQFYLPGNFNEELYNLLDCWLPNQRAVNPDRSNLMDSSTIHLEEENSSAGDSQQFEPDDNNDIGNEENVPPAMNGTNVAPSPDEHGRRKKTKSDRLDQHFSSANKTMLDAMAVENDKHDVHDKAVLECLQTQIAAELEMHERELAVRTHVGNQVAAALGDLAKSFADFTSKMAKNK
jgi:hypothetical protein